MFLIEIELNHLPPPFLLSSISWLHSVKPLLYLSCQVDSFFLFDCFCYIHVYIHSFVHTFFFMFSLVQGVLFCFSLIDFGLNLFLCLEKKDFFP